MLKLISTVWFSEFWCLQQSGVLSHKVWALICAYHSRAWSVDPTQWNKLETTRFNVCTSPPPLPNFNARISRCINPAVLQGTDKMYLSKKLVKSYIGSFKMVHDYSSIHRIGLILDRSMNIQWFVRFLPLHLQFMMMYCYITNISYTWMSWLP